MYINFWYPIGRVEEITPEQPFQARIFGLPYVAFRDTQGTAHVLADTCVHRGGSLSAGSLKDNCIVCPYHGWRYAGDGQCMQVPSLANKKPPARAKVDSYPVEEKYGIVFAFLGDLPAPERPPIYEVEEYGQEGWKSELYTLEVACYYQRSVENGLDPIHNEFVHPLQGSPLMDPELQRKPLPITKIPWGSKFWMPFSEKHDPDTEIASQRGAALQNHAGSWHHGPNQLITWIHFSTVRMGETAFHQYFFEQPLDEGHTRIFFLNMRNWLLEDEKDEQVRKVTLKVVGEDIKVLETLRPIRTPELNTKEILLPGDAAVVSYRECLGDWENLGWRIDNKALREQQGDVAFAIPCPSRRTSGNWVLDPVPLVPSQQTDSPRLDP
jgi:phenylpropionate dioxygenase-like ring-hydroxylating dioxygenase large terminal subunit